jgi:Putative adhesin
MTSWTVDNPATLDFDEVTDLEVRLIGGSVAVLASDERPSVAVTRVWGRPLTVGHTDGVLTVGYEEPTWDHLLEWLRPQPHSADVAVIVPAGCRVRLGVVNAAALLSGLASGAAVKSVSGGITLDGVTGDVTAQSVSGDVEASDIDGEVRFTTVAGDLTLAGGVLRSLSAESVSGDVAADVDLAPHGSVDTKTLSGKVMLRLPAQTQARISLRSLSGRVRSEFAGARSGNVGGMSGNVSVTSASGAITLLRRERVESETR